MKKLVFVIVSFVIIAGSVFMLTTQHFTYKQSSSVANTGPHPKYVIKKGQSFNSQNKTMSSAMTNQGGVQNIPNVNLNKTITITEMPYLQTKWPQIMGSVFLGDKTLFN